MGSYLVTGGAGFIGGAIAQQLLLCGHEVVTIDNLSTGKQSRIPSGVHFIEGNTFDSAVIAALDNKHFEAIIHMAGQSSGEVSFENPTYDLQTNAQATLMLLKYAKDNNIKRFIYASSMSVYGDQKNSLVNENDQAIPKSFYAVGKLASENYMRIFSNEYGLICTALRFFNVYGIGQNLDNLKQGMASIYLAQAIKNHSIVVKGSKDRFRDFVYIDDVVNSVMLALNRSNGFDYFNVSTKIKTKVEDVIDNICKKSPYPVETRYIDGTPGDQFGIYGENQKIKDCLGWKPTVSFEDGISRMIEWAVSNVSI